MALEISAWHRELGDGQIRFTPPEGKALGEIAIHDRLYPIRRISQHVRERFPNAVRGVPLHLVTLEGEDATMVDLESDGQFHCLAAIFGDELQTVIVATTPSAEQRDRFRQAAHEIVMHLPLGLGLARFRRFKYRAPAGWQGDVRGLVTTWSPSHRATITVFPARPINDSFHRDTFFRDESFAGFDLEPESRTSLILRTLRGTYAHAKRGAEVVVTAALESYHHVYVMRLATTPDHLAADEAVFLDLVHSCVPVPSRVAPIVKANPFMECWA